MSSEVLILSPFFSPNIGGVETHLDDLVEVLKKRTAKSYVLTYQPLMMTVKAPPIETKENVEIHRIEWFRNFFYKVEPYPILDFLYLTPRLMLAAIWFLLTHRNIKTVHAQGINAACIGLILKWLFGIKLIISTHAVYEFHKEQSASLFAKVTRFVFNKSDKIFSLLEHSKQELIKLGIDAAKIQPYTYWIDLQKFAYIDKQKAKQKLNWDPSKTHILFVGRLIEKKGVNELIAASQLLTTDNRQLTTIHLIGSGDLDEQVKAKQSSTLQYHGRISNTDLPQYFQAADIFIIPSTHEEGAGRVIMESLACGTPVIGAKRGGIPEILTNEVGELIDVSPENIVKGMQQLQHRQTTNHNLSEQCHKYAVKHFSAENANIIINSYL